WMKPRQPQWSDVEWQIRNWLYFTWLSGDHIVEQHIHNIDVANWALGAHPMKAVGVGGRQWRTDPAYGHIYDHFAIDFEYANAEQDLVPADVKFGPMPVAPVAMPGQTVLARSWRSA